MKGRSRRGGGRDTGSRTCREKKRKSEMSEEDRTKGQRSKGPKETSIFSSRCIQARKNRVRTFSFPSRSLVTTYYVLSSPALVGPPEPSLLHVERDETEGKEEREGSLW